MRRVAVCFAFLFFFAIVLIGSGELIGAPIVGVPVSPTPEISYILDTAAIPPLVPGQHSRLVVHNCFGGFGTVYAPSATVDGTEIAVTQNLVWGGSSEACAWHIIDLGLLPAATYHVTMLRTSSTGTDASDFRFIVQQPDRTAACTQSQSVTALPDGTALLRYEGQYYGSAPSFGLPAVVSTACCNTDDVKWLRIVQPVDDTAHGQYVCHAEQLNIGHVADGVYVVDWLYSPLAPFSGRPSPSLGQFKWSGGTLQCSSVSAFSIGGPAVANEPIDAMRTHLFDGYWRSSFKVSRTSNRITVDELLTIGEGPVPSAPPDCGSIHVPIGPLPAGEYDVVWTVHYDTGGGSETGTLHVTVSNPKRRAARH